MRHTPEFQFGEGESAPKSLIYLIAATAIISILASLLNGLFAFFFNSSGPEDWLTLSSSAVDSFFIWQPFTYLFTENSYGAGITISYLINLSFTLYILWLLGSSLMERIGESSFFKLYFGSGVTAGIIALFIMKITGQNSFIATPWSALLALLTFWAMLYKDAELSFLLFIQFQAKWILAAVFIGLTLSALSHLDLVSFALYFTAAFFGYCYGIFAYQLKSPFPFLEPFEDFLLKLFHQKDESEGKIIDFQTGRALDDEIFVDNMLAKISQHGEDSLTFYERKRLNEISKRKKQ